MAIINPTIPASGDERGTGELALRTAIIAVLAEFNGNIENANIKDATITAAKFAAGAVSQPDLLGGVQDGVWDAGDGMVTQRAAGANMSVDVAPGKAIVTSALGVVTVAYIAGKTALAAGATVNLVVAAAHATLPRIDSVFLTSADVLSVATGTPTAGTTLDTRVGAPALPAGSIRLADILVGAAAASVSNSTIRDRRQWARGAHAVLSRTAGDLSLTSTTEVPFDATNLKARVECSGAPMRVTLHAAGGGDSTNYITYLRLWEDGAFKSPQERPAFGTGGGASAPGRFGEQISFLFTPTAGSHTYEFAWYLNLGGRTTYVSASSTNPAYMVIEEVVRQNTKNNATTSG